jgi:ABC-type branched-subunit amino acid transport system substrate-binding protein
MKTIIDAFNTRGGIAGRKIVPVYYANDENSSKTYAQREQERCAVFTEDHKVFAVYPGYTTSENEAACLQKTGTLLVVPNNSANASGRFDTTSFKQFPNLYEPVTPNADRMFSTMVKRLNAAGYFDKGAKIGLLYTSDAATKRAVDRSLKPALAALGLKADQEASVLSPYNLNDLAPTESQIQSAELHFAAAGITHVIIPTGLGSLISGGFMKTAASQNYKPRYGLESGSIGVETEAFSGTDVTDQLHRAVYMGWDPYGDVRDEAATAPMRVCNAISHKAGMPTDARAMGLCDFLSILDSGLSHASQPTQQAFASGLSRAGTVAMTRTYSTDYSSGRRDGAARVRMAHYDFSCHAAGNKFCWRYDTPQVRF